MPKKAERKLRATARKKFDSITSPRARKYIYGGLRDTGWKPRQQRRKKR